MKRSALIVCLALIAIACGPTASPQTAPAQTPEPAQATQQAGDIEARVQTAIAATQAAIPTVAPALPTATAPAATAVPELVPVVDVVDGDTVKVSLQGEVETVRLIGIDTPEVVDPRRPVQCFGEEASARAKQLLTGARVRLEQDPSQDTRDRYGRLLAYVWLEDGRLFNRLMIAEGLAHEYAYDVPYEYQANFKDTERQAQEQELGLWSSDTCNGDTTQPAVVPTEVRLEPTAAPTRIPATTKPAVQVANTPTAAAPAVKPQPTQPAGGASVYYANCAAARAAGAAPILRGQPGYRPALDRDNDGVACE